MRAQKPENEVSHSDFDMILVALTSIEYFTHLNIL